MDETRRVARPRPRRQRRVPVLLLVFVLVCTAAAGLWHRPVSGAPSRDRRTPPNILFILTDDLDVAELSVMPNVKALIADTGTTFQNFFVSVSLCCPSRTTCLRGQYAHNTGIQTNGGTNGGFETAHARGLEQSTVATWLHDAGYRTALIGKYLNGYPLTAGARFVPPGWDEWDSPAGGSPYSEFNYTLNENGTLVSYGADPADYGTDVYAQKAAAFIGAATRDGKPFFVDLAVYAPHQPATPAPRHADLFPGATAPRTPSWDEADVSDKPAWLRAFPLLRPAQITNLDDLYRRRLQSLQAVDEAVAMLVETLRASGQLDRTYVFFSSDNGFHIGQHRLPRGKQTAYEEDVHVPLVVSGPGVRKGRTISPLAGNVDLAPTFAALGRARAPEFVDGRSLVPLLHGRPRRWRRAYLVEHWQVTDEGEPEARAAGAPLEPPDEDDVDIMPAGTTSGRPVAQSPIPDYRGIRTRRHLYVEYVTGEKELYDLRHDPAELENVAATAKPRLVRRLGGQLARLKACTGAKCRRGEERG